MGSRKEMNWQVVIGLEIHVELNTQSKLFTTSSTCFGAQPNSQANEVDLALPGTLPRLNKEALRKAIRLGKEKALNVMVGYMMKKTQGKANAQKAAELIKKLIAN